MVTKKRSHPVRKGPVEHKGTRLEGCNLMISLFKRGDCGDPLVLPNEHQIGKKPQRKLTTGLGNHEGEGEENIRVTLFYIKHASIKNTKKKNKQKKKKKCA